MTRVLVVDDQELVRAGLASLLRTAPDITEVREVSDGEAAVAAAERERFDVVLMDIRLPGMNGIAATETILRKVPDPPHVIVLTTFDVDEYVYEALRAGASGFLLKDTSPRRLIEAVGVVTRGEMLFAPAVTRRLVEAYTRQPASAVEPEALSDLTAREREVLRLVGLGIDNEAIAGQLHVTEGTVKTHLHRIMTKLSLNSRAQAVVMAYESGLVVPGRTR
ncbi:response regulator [Streptomyces fungicidicus]|jgi:DNA-binding NarL/FixJ family response regulator|uniref:DNA-binding response regulator n=1 Tax=Streptomyces fungicidicus TaxID=68203 RepID=A0A494US44_9ACTN|nr:MULTISPECIES: response regulator transcription factor [Streptomyces]AYL37663.1 DNA-binding response regulator [Streptomyces fungicidicus]QKW02042.1 response regulator transcription factor [Streptomyces sp. NA02536]TQL20795.1 LuxR family two component transcriptional regulator [Streptomyces sp. SLBN-134]